MTHRNSHDSFLTITLLVALVSVALGATHGIGARRAALRSQRDVAALSASPDDAISYSSERCRAVQTSVAMLESSMKAIQAQRRTDKASAIKLSNMRTELAKVRVTLEGRRDHDK